MHEGLIALRLNDGAYAQVPAVNLQSKTFTLAFRVSGMGQKDIQPVFGDWPSTDNGNFMFLFKKQKLQISRRADGATWHYINTTTVTNGIHHIAVTWNAQEVTIFLDGKRKETTSMEKKYFEGTANNGEWFDIGKTGDHSMNGWLYELFLANTVLTEEEIYKLAFQGMFICRVD